MSSDHLTRLVGSDSKWDSIVSQGLLVKLSTRQFTILISVFTFAFAFLVARLFRVFCLFTFWLFLCEGQREDQIDQLRVAVVNFRTPFHVIGERITWRMIFRGRAKERNFALTWLAGAVAFLLLGLSLPVLIALFPVANGYSGTSSCSFGPTGENEQQAFFNTYLRLEQQTALSHTDAQYFDYEGFSARDVGFLGSLDIISKSSTCPNHATSSACLDGDALHFNGEYWLRPSDLGVGNIKNLALGVNTSCYKVVDSEREITPPPNITDSFRNFGLFYGSDDNVAALRFPNLTKVIQREQVHGRGYWVYPYMFSEEDSTVSGKSPWTPREDLHHEGDVTLLIYHLGATYAFEQGNDPLFATLPLNTTNLRARDWASENQEQRTLWGDQKLFKPKTQTVAVLCNTTYMLCDSINLPAESGHCLKLGGEKKVRAFVNSLRESTGQEQIESPRQGFLDLFADIAHFGGMDVAAAAINGVFASNLLIGTLKYQQFLDQVSGQRELTRLFLSTRTRFLLAARRAVLNEWGLPVLQLGFHADDIVPTMVATKSLRAMCRATLIPDSNFKTTTARPWIIVACVWLAVVLLTYSAPLVLMFHWRWAEDIERRWMSRKAGSLHKKLALKQSTASEMGLRDFGSGNIPPILERREVLSPVDQRKVEVEEEAGLIGGQEGSVEMRGNRSG